MRHLFSELGQGLRRNVSMHLAVVLTLFVSLTLVGIGTLMQQESDLVIDRLGDQLKVQVWLCNADDDNPACVAEVTEAQENSIRKVIEENPEVDEVDYESQEVAAEKTRELLGEELFEGDDPVMTPEDLRASFKITLEDPQQSAGIISAVEGLDGVSYLTEAEEQIGGVFTIIDFLKYGSLAAAAVLALAALLMVANTIRLAALARRREIGIMRLVGASSLYITVPFLLEQLFAAIVGVALATGALALLTKFVIMDRISESVAFLPWVGWSEWWFSVIVIAAMAPVLTLVPTLLLTRKYVKV